MSELKRRRGQVYPSAKDFDMHTELNAAGELARWEVEAVLAIADKLEGFTLAHVRKPRGACVAIAIQAMREARRVR